VQFFFANKQKKLVLAPTVLLERMRLLVLRFVLFVLQDRGATMPRRNALFALQVVSLLLRVPTRAFHVKNAIPDLIRYQLDRLLAVCANLEQHQLREGLRFTRVRVVLRDRLLQLLVRPLVQNVPLDPFRLQTSQYPAFLVLRENINQTQARHFVFLAQVEQPTSFLGNLLVQRVFLGLLLLLLLAVASNVHEDLLRPMEDLVAIAKDSFLHPDLAFRPVSNVQLVNLRRVLGVLACLALKAAIMLMRYSDVSLVPMERSSILIRALAPLAQLDFGLEKLY
jgi:hypothetical protein